MNTLWQRPTQAEMYLAMLQVLERRSTCLRRSVACILTDDKHRVLSTGYNGVAYGQPHCNEQVFDDEDIVHHPNACQGAGACSGERLDECQAIHAEQNALLQCHDVDKIHYVYVSCSPCIHCMKLLMNTGCKIIYCREIYDRKAVELFENSQVGRQVVHV
jgi:dCMP deaminase